MTSISTQWDSSWTATSIASSSITNTGTATTSSAIDSSGSSGTLVSVTIAYGSTANQGVDVSVFRETSAGYETALDRPTSFQMPYVVSTTRERTFTVMSDHVGKFKICLDNQTGATVTATVSYKKAVVQIA